ncbi:MAG: ATP-binding cassette domain-containing protein [Candidatus Neomarinimicrobiota bacterium]
MAVSGLCAFYPGAQSILSRDRRSQILFDIFFKLNSGEIISVAGESGCGKSTLGKTLIGLVQDIEGKFLYRNKIYNPLQMDNLRRDIQIVFQDPYGSLNPRLTIGQVLDEVVERYSTSNDRPKQVYKLMNDVQLPADIYFSYPHELSGGQRQRACIARALAVQPKVLICDEIISALDISIQSKILNLILDLKSEYELGILFTTHDLKVVRAISDGILIMSKGRIVERGTADEIFDKPKHMYTKKLLSS